MRPTPSDYVFYTTHARVRCGSVENAKNALLAIQDNRQAIDGGRDWEVWRMHLTEVWAHTNGTIENNDFFRVFFTELPPTSDIKSEVFERAYIKEPFDVVWGKKYGALGFSSIDDGARYLEYRGEQGPGVRSLILGWLGDEIRTCMPDCSDTCAATRGISARVSDPVGCADCENVYQGGNFVYRKWEGWDK